ncbi:hypothetical protein BU198_01615 [Streptomyces sp. CBMA156]|nr:hypothetical protein [Streptomyces sp. CBMA156]
MVRAGRGASGSDLGGRCGAVSTVRRRRLGDELRRLREQAMIAADAAAEATGMSLAKLNRIESARTAAKIEDVNKLLNRCGCDNEEFLAGLIAITKDGSKRGWWLSYRESPRHHGTAARQAAHAQPVGERQHPGDAHRCTCAPRHGRRLLHSRISATAGSRRRPRGGRVERPLGRGCCRCGVVRGEIRRHPSGCSWPR